MGNIGEIIKVFIILFIIGLILAFANGFVALHGILLIKMKTAILELIHQSRPNSFIVVLELFAYVFFFLLMLFIELGVLRLIMPRIFKKIFSLYLKALGYPFVLIWRGVKKIPSLFIGSSTSSMNPTIEQTMNNQVKSAITLETQRGNKIAIPNPFRGVLVIGGAGSGKSESFAIPFIREFSKQNFTGIVYDFKFPTLGQEVENYYTENSTPVNRYYLNFGNAQISHRVNPLNPKYMPFSAYAREYASAIIKNLMKESIKKEDFWSRSTTDLLTACIWYLKKRHPKYCDLPHVLALLQNDYKLLIKKLSEDSEVRSMIISLATAIESDAGDQIAGVVGSLQGAVAQINTPEFMYIFGGDEFDLRLNDPEHPSAMIVGSHPTISGTIAPLCSLVISVASKMMNQPNRLPSFVMLDESPTVFIPNIEVIPNTGRSNKMATILFVQDISQLIDGYGKEKADVLFSACGSHFYGRVASSQTADILSKQFGREDRLYESSSTNQKTGDFLKKNVGKSFSYQERDILRPSEFMNLGVGEFVGRVVENDKPLIFAQYKMSHSKVKADLSNIIPRNSNNNIQNYYNQVAEESAQILRGEMEYSEIVNREELIKPSPAEIKENQENEDDNLNYIKSFTNDK